MNGQKDGKKLLRKYAKRITAALMTLALCLALLPAAALADVVFPVYVVGGMGEDGYIKDAKYNELFNGADAVNGIQNIIGAGEFYINGIAIPATEAECLENYPNGYTINEAVWLYKKESDGKWYGGNGGKTAFDSYMEAAYATAIGLPPGLEAKISHTGGGTLANKIETEYLEGIIVGSITHDTTAHTYKVARDAMNAVGEKPYDGNRFTGTSARRSPKRTLTRAFRRATWRSSGKAPTAGI